MLVTAKINRSLHISERVLEVCGALVEGKARRQEKKDEDSKHGSFCANFLSCLRLPLW